MFKFTVCWNMTSKNPRYLSVSWTVLKLSIEMTSKYYLVTLVNCERHTYTKKSSDRFLHFIHPLPEVPQGCIFDQVWYILTVEIPGTKITALVMFGVTFSFWPLKLYEKFQTTNSVFSNQPQLMIDDNCKYKIKLMSFCVQKKTSHLIFILCLKISFLYIKGFPKLCNFKNNQNLEKHKI